MTVKEYIEQKHRIPNVIRIGERTLFSKMLQDNYPFELENKEIIRIICPGTIYDTLVCKWNVPFMVWIGGKEVWTKKD